MTRSLRWKGAAFTVPFQLGFAFLYLLPIGYAVYQSLYREQQSGLGLGGSTGPPNCGSPAASRFRSCGARWC